MKRSHALIIVSLALLPSFTTSLYFNVLPGAFFTTVIYGFNKVFEIAFPLIWVALFFKSSIRPHRPSLRSIVAGVGSGLVIALLVLVVYYGMLRGGPYIDGVQPAVMARLGKFGATTYWRFLLFMSFIVIANSAIEEFYWRWFVFGQLRRRWSVALCAFLSAVTFMVHHIVVLGAYIKPEFFLSVSLVLAVGIGIGGAFWAWLYHRTGSYAAPWISHLIADVAVLVIALDILGPVWR